jgi:TonB-linked SusC/RagA family outer membrane protein
MGKSRWVAAALLMALLPTRGVAQQSTGTLQGTVVDAASQLPLAGVQITVRGTRLATPTTAEGRFQIANVPAGERVVRAELIGYAAVEQTVTIPTGGTTTINLSLVQQAIQLDALVVTALGIEREARSMTTATQQVSGAQLVEARSPNLVSSLSGKVSGVQIMNSNTPGGSARIVVRGATSMTGSNQPLFVIDGVPVSNAAGFGGTFGYNGIDYGNAISDINPDDVESMTVLKGPNAAALYGSRAANGAIIITTKKGKRAGSGQVAVRTGITFETPLKLPTYQNLYGQGSNGLYDYVNGKGGGLYDDNDESWGPRLDAGLKRRQFFSNGDSVPWVSHPNNVRDFFEVGRMVDTEASFSTSSDLGHVRLSLGRMDHNGMYPSYQQTRTSISLTGGSNLGERLRTDVSMRYVKQDTRNRVAQGYGEHNPMWQFLWFGRQVDTRLLKETRRNPDGTQFNWNTRWSNNPYWTAFENKNVDGRDRIVASISLDYDLTPWLSAKVRTGTDWSREQRRLLYAAGTIRSDVGANGAFGETNVFRQETNSEFLLTGNWPTLGDFSLTTYVGGGRRDNDYNYNDVYLRDLVVPGVYSRTNSAMQTPGMDDSRTRQRVNSLRAQAVLGYRGYLTLQMSGTNDWSSTLPEKNRSYFYPEISSGFIFTEAFPSLKNGLLSYGKVFAGWAQVGNDAPPYQLVDPYIGSVPFAGVPRLSASTVLRNANLKPEQIQGWELGTELAFLDNRLSIDAEYAYKATTNQIMALDISPLTGFNQRYINAGKVSSRSVGLTVNAVPVKLSNGLEWDVTAMYTRERGYVDELYGDLETMVLGTYYSVSVEGRKGERLGNMYGRQYVRDSKGNIVVGSNGVPLNSATNPVGLLGNYNPDWTGSLTNRLSYKNLDLGVQFDIRQGGAIYSLTNYYGRRSGVLIETLVGRENSADQKDYVVPGVKVVGKDTVKNDIPVTAQLYHRNLGGISEAFTYDASFIKLRELRLGYNVPRSITGRWGVSGLRVALVGRDLWLKSDVPHIDPETAFNSGNVQGFEYSQSPTPRSIGISVSVTP